MSIYFQLKKLNLVHWGIIMIGFDKGLISKQDIEDYSTLILENSEVFDPEIALLANAQNYTDIEIKEMIQTQLNPNKFVADVEINKLRLAALLSLNEENITDEEKCDKLQMLYAAFDYPDDMSACSIYSVNSKISPIKAMNNLIVSLEQKYLQKK
jgi:hypothetical protein